MNAFDFELRTRIVFGRQRIDDLGEFAAQLRARRALVVSDPGIVEAGHTERGCAALRTCGIEWQVFDGVHENPTTEDVAAGRQLAEQFRPDLIVGLGGGSSMDCAKGINFLHTGGGEMQDYQGVGRATQEMLPMIAIPTTAGTGSEAQSFALISDAQTDEKMACGDKKASFRIALLDPELTLTQPPRITALTGIDALAHAVESYVSKRRNPVSTAFSREAWRLLSAHFPQVLDEPENLSARAGMQLGACFAGLAIENSMLGAAHALANPLTAKCGVPHGEAVGMMLPHVVRFNGTHHDGWYGELLEFASGTNGHRPATGNIDGNADQLATWVATQTQRAGLAGRLADCGIREQQLAELAEGAAQQWTGQFNPRQVDVATLLELYRQAL